MQAGARPANLAADKRERNETTRIVGAVRVLRHAHAPEDDGTFGTREATRNLAQRIGGNAADRFHLLRREVLHILGDLIKTFDVGLYVLLVVKFLADDDIEHGVEHRHVRTVLKLHHLPGVALERLPARVHHDQLGAALGRLLEESGGDRVVFGRIGADHNDEVGILAFVESRGHRGGANAFQQRRHRRGVAEPRTVVDVIRAKAGAHQLLEKIGLFIRALGRTEAGQRTRTIAIANFFQTGSGALHCLFPRRFAEVRKWVRRIDQIVGSFRNAILAHHRLGQALRITDVVKAEAALHAKAVLVCRTVAARYVQKRVVLDVVGELAADAAVRAYAVDLTVGKLGTHVLVIDQRRRHQRTGRTGLHAFAAGDASGLAHRVVEIGDDLLAVTAACHPDDIVDLHLAAGADAEIALNAGVEIDRHCRVAAVGRRHFLALGEAADVDAHPVGPAPELRLRIMRSRTLGLIRDQQLEDHLPRGLGTVGGRLHFHAFRRLADTAGGEHALAFDLDHAGAAIAVGAIARLW